MQLEWVLPGFTGFYRVLPSFTGFYWVLLGLTGFSWTCCESLSLVLTWRSIRTGERLAAALLQRVQDGQPGTPGVPVADVDVSGAGLPRPRFQVTETKRNKRKTHGWAHWAASLCIVPGFTGLYRVGPGFTGFFWAVRTERKRATAFRHRFQGQRPGKELRPSTGHGLSSAGLSRAGFQVKITKNHKKKPKKNNAIHQRGSWVLPGIFARAI